MESFLKQFAIQTHINVAWGEMDALGHVNNASYFRYFETARIDFMKQTGLMSVLADPSTSPVLSETNARFKRPVTFPDTLHVGTHISDIQEDRFIMHYTIFSEALQAICTTGFAKVVMFDMRNQQKAAIPSHVLTVLEQHSQK